MMNGQEIALKALIRQRHMSYEAFCREWDRAARATDEALKGRYPGHAQYYRWLRGELSNKRPYPDACRMLEVMFPGWSVEMLFSAYPGELPETAVFSTSFESPEVPALEDGISTTTKLADLAGAYVGRAEFISEFPLFDLLQAASLVRASGLSLNLLTQHFSDTQIRRLVENGTRFQLIFLNPDSEAVKLREREESYSDGFLGGLTGINIKIMCDRVRGQLRTDLHDRFAIALSDDVVRFNIILIDDRFCIFQPYLPEARGVDSPTFVAKADSMQSGFFHVFEQVVTSLWKRARIILCRLMPNWCASQTLPSISRVA